MNSQLEYYILQIIESKSYQSISLRVSYSFMILYQEVKSSTELEGEDYEKRNAFATATCPAAATFARLQPSPFSQVSPRLLYKINLRLCSQIMHQLSHPSSFPHLCPAPLPPQSHRQPARTTRGTCSTSTSCRLQEMSCALVHLSQLGLRPPPSSLKAQVTLCTDTVSHNNERKRLDLLIF